MINNKLKEKIFKKKGFEIKSGSTAVTKPLFLENSQLLKGDESPLRIDN
jgi:hypothetical protein